MIKSYNVYCDESCHLENDNQDVMVLGATWCPTEKVAEISKRLKEIKDKHGLAPAFEIKWSKVSPAKSRFYLDIVDYFFDDDDLHFRSIIIPDKDELRHREFRQTHDDWYYKMYFDMLKVILSPDAHYLIYLDIKDSLGGAKIRRLHEILCNNMYDFSRTIIQKIQLVRSNELQILQLTDLLIGAISYVNRGLHANVAKVLLVNRIIERSNYNLMKSTLLRESKFNLFKWKAKNREND